MLYGVSSHDLLLSLVTENQIIERSCRTSDLFSYKAVWNVNDRAQAEKECAVMEMPEYL